MKMSFASRCAVVFMMPVFAAGLVSADWKTAVDAYQRHDWSMAIENLEEIVEAHPDYAPAQNLLGLSLVAAQRLEEAEAPLRRAVVLKPDEAAYSIALTQLLLKKKDADGAWTVISTVDQEGLSPPDRKAYVELFLGAAMKTKHLEEAARLLESMLEKDASNAGLWARLAQVYRGMKQPKKAFDAMKKASDLEPENAAAARAALRAGKDAAADEADDGTPLWMAAGELGDRLCGIEESPENWKLSGEAWMGAKRYTKALELFRKAQAEKPSDPLLHYYVSLCLSGLDRLDEAKTEVEAGISSAAEEDPIRSRLYRQAAFLADASHRFEDAIQWYEKLGDQEKIAEMEEKLRIAIENETNDVYCRKQATQITGLKKQVQALKDLGDLGAAEQVENQLDLIEVRYNRDCRE